MVDAVVDFQNAVTLVVPGVIVVLVGWYLADAYRGLDTTFYAGYVLVWSVVSDILALVLLGAVGYEVAQFTGLSAALVDLQTIPLLVWFGVPLVLGVLHAYLVNRDVGAVIRAWAQGGASIKRTSRDPWENYARVHEATIVLTKDGKKYKGTITDWSTGDSVRELVLSYPYQKRYGAWKPMVPDPSDRTKAHPDARLYLASGEVLRMLSVPSAPRGTPSVSGGRTASVSGSWMDPSTTPASNSRAKPPTQ